MRWLQRHVSLARSKYLKLKTKLNASLHPMPNIVVAIRGIDGVAWSSGDREAYHFVCSSSSSSSGDEHRREGQTADEKR
jgi:hypothetical protein